MRTFSWAPFRAIIFFALIALFVLFVASNTAILSAASTPTVVSIGATSRTGVKHFGINLGTQNSWDSGQMVKNLVSENPGFEGEIWQSILHCQSAGSTYCTDSNPDSVWPANFFAGASAEFIYGAAVGETATVSSNTTASKSAGTGVTIYFNEISNAAAVGDYVVVRMSVPGNAQAGWWTSASGGAAFTTEFQDLSPETQGKQALRITATGSAEKATVSSYFDSSAGYSFIQLNGPYTLTFRAKGTGGSMQMGVSLKRMPNSGTATTFLSQTLNLTNTWQDYTLSFNASDSGAAGTVGLVFTLSNSAALIDDVSLSATGSPSNTTAFRDEVVNTLQTLQPGILRDMDSGTNWGSTIDNLLDTQFVRVRDGYNNFTVESDQAPMGLHDFLQLCQTVGAEPWFTMPAGMSTQEMQNLMDYLGGSASTVYGARRAALGQSQPWTSVFPKIHLEFGNEVWNTANPGATMSVSTAYAARASAIFSAARQSASYNSSVIDLVIDGWAALPSWNKQVLASASGYNTVDAAPYLFYSFNDASSNEAIFGPMFAEPELLDSTSSGVMAQQASTAAAAVVPARLSIYEVQLSTTSGTASQSAVNSAVPSLGAGLAVADHMLLMLRDLGITDQNMFSLSGFQTTFSNSLVAGEKTPLWGGVVDMGATNRVRPVFLAQELVNTALLPTMLATSQSGANPTWDQTTSANDSVSLATAHYIQSFAFTDGSQNKVVLINLHRTQSLPVSFSGVNAPVGSVTLETLTSVNITDDNEAVDNVSITSGTASLPSGQSLTLPPYSITVLTYAAPSNSVSVNSVTCAAQTLNPSTSTSCTASVSTTGSGSPSVTWSASAGTISSSGVYTAPATAPTAGTVSITAASAQYPTKSASFTIGVSSSPQISSVAASNVTATSATISWQVSAASYNGVDYGTTARYGLTTPWTNATSASPSITLTGLSANTKYYILVWSQNPASGVTADSAITFNTAAQ